MNTRAHRPAWLPYFIASVVVAILAGLGLWQISRGLDKQLRVDAWEGADSATRYVEGADVESFQKLRVKGRYDSDRQLLLDNMIVNGRNGHFVITPLEIDGSDTVLLVNRGWIDLGEADALREQVAVGESPRRLSGRVGRMPRPGMRMGDPFMASDGWPRHAVYPTREEVADLLQVSTAPFVLLLDEGDADGFVRRWEPDTMSASRHYGYAFQWFAMAAVLSGLTIWRFRRRRGK